MPKPVRYAVISSMICKKTPKKNHPNKLAILFLLKINKENANKKINRAMALKFTRVWRGYKL